MLPLFRHGSRIMTWLRARQPVLHHTGIYYNQKRMCVLLLQIAHRLRELAEEYDVLRRRLAARKDTPQLIWQQVRVADLSLEKMPYTQADLDLQCGTTICKVLPGK